MNINETQPLSMVPWQEQRLDDDPNGAEEDDNEEAVRNKRFDFWTILNYLKLDQLLNPSAQPQEVLLIV